MKFILKKFFQQIVAYETDAVNMTWRVDVEIKELTEKYWSDEKKQNKDEFKDTLYQTAFIAEQEGFLLGMKYAFKLIVALLSD